MYKLCNYFVFKSYLILEDTFTSNYLFTKNEFSDNNHYYKNLLF